MLRAYRYRLYPTKNQIEAINRNIGCARWVYNYGLNLKIQTYLTTKKAISRYDIQSMLPELKNSPETLWLKEAPASSLQSSLEKLDRSFVNFFRERAAFPKFKSKKHGTQSYSYPQYVTIDFSNKRVRLPKVGSVKFADNRIFDGVIKTTTVSHKPSGKYFVSILIETGKPVPTCQPVNPKYSIGIDTGLKTFIVSSDGRHFENNRYFKKSLLKLKFQQRKMSKRVRGSKNKNKQRLRVALLHEKIANQRIDYIHKITHKLTTENQVGTICIEDLNVMGMMQNHKLAQSLNDVSLSKFYEILTYKCAWRGINLIKIGRWDASSKTCSVCGTKNKELKLSDRMWACGNCGATHDRDLNAAINIKNFGLHPKNFVGAGSPELTPVEMGQVAPSEKQEYLPKGE